MQAVDRWCVSVDRLGHVWLGYATLRAPLDAAYHLPYLPSDALCILRPPARRNEIPAIRSPKFCDYGLIFGAR